MFWLWLLTRLNVSLSLSSNAVLDRSFRKKGLHCGPKDTGLALDSLGTSCIRPKSRLKADRTRYVLHLSEMFDIPTEPPSNAPRANKVHLIQLGQIVVLVIACKDQYCHDILVVWRQGKSPIKPDNYQAIDSTFGYDFHSLPSSITIAIW